MRLLKIGIGLLGGFALLGCSQSPDTIESKDTPGIHLPSPIVNLVRPTLTIQELGPNLVNRSIQVEGTVEQQVPLLEGMLYLINDTTGTLWVFSLDTTPMVGTGVKVAGILQYEEIVVSGADISEYYLQEQSRSPLETVEDNN